MCLFLSFTVFMFNNYIAFFHVAIAFFIVRPNMLKYYKQKFSLYKISNFKENIHNYMEIISY